MTHNFELPGRRASRCAAIATASFAVLLVSGVARAQPTNDVCVGAVQIPAAGPFPYTTALVPDITLATEVGDPVLLSGCTSATPSRGIWYELTPAVTGTYTLSTCGNGTTVTNTIIAVFTASGGCGGTFTQLPNADGGCNDDGCKSLSAQAFTSPVLTAGTTYYVLVYKSGTTAPTASTSAVALTVNLHQLPANDVCAGANPLVLDSPVAAATWPAANDFELTGPACFTGASQTSSTAPGRDAVWSFTAPDADSYSFRLRTTESTDPANPVLFVASSCPSGSSPQQVSTCVAAANRTNASTTNAHLNEEVTCVPMAQGDTYYVFADEHVASVGYGYEVEVTRCRPESEPNGTPATASPLQCGSQGGISAAGDVDFYDLGVVAPDYRVFTMVDGSATSATDFDLRVTTASTTLEYDDSNNDTEYGGTAPNIAGRALPGSVPLYLRVNYYSSSTSSEPYRLYSVIRPPSSQATAEVEPNDVMADASTGLYVSGELSGAAPSTDVDFYAFSATGGDVVFISLDGAPDRTTPILTAELRVLDQSGATLFEINDTSTTLSTTAGSSLTSTSPSAPGDAAVFRAPYTGTFYVRVGSGSTTTGAGDYLLSISLNCSNGLPAPTLTSINPTSGPATVPTEVTLTGTNFVSGANVMIDGAMATNVTVVNATTITADTPVRSPGQVSVTVFNPDGQRASLPGGFTFISPPVISGIVPSSGPTAGGTAIQIQGSAFQSGLTVTIGGTAVTPTNVTATAIDVVTPAGAAGGAPVVVTNPDNQQGTGTFTFVSPPVITGIAPTSGPTAGGNSAVISGTGFVTGSTVTFDGTAATVTAAAATSLTVIVPAGAAGPADVVVTNPDGQSDTEAALYTFIAPPMVTSLTPASGLSTGGTSVVISGQDFQSGATVTFDGVDATSVTFVSASELVAITPGHAPGAVDVTVANPDGQSDTVVGGFTYIAAGPAPTITQLSPNSGTTAGGTTVVITGADFQVGATVTFGTQPAASVNYDASTQLTVTTPPQPFGTVDVTVTNPDNQSGTLANGYTYDHPAPQLTSITPSGGPTAGGTQVTLAGANFLPGATFTVDGVAATNITVVNATTVTGTVPAHTAGVVDVVLTNADGKTVTLPQAYTYVAPPAIAAVAPTQGTTLGGTAFTLSGQAFLPGATVTFGSAAATNVTVVNATTITGTTPAHAAGSVDVTVTNADGQTHTLPNAFTFVPPPVVTSIVPNSGPTAGGTQVTLTGSGFRAGVTVTFRGTPAAQVTVVSSTQITAVTPAEAEGPADVVVTNEDFQSTSVVDGFTFVAPPALTSLSPTQGSTTGGLTVTLTGDKFRSGAVVRFGTQSVVANFVSVTELRATTPPGPAGTVDVTVINPDGQSVTLADAFTYVAPPTVTSVTPAQGPTAGGTAVTVKGADFVAGATVTFGGVAGTDVMVTTTDTITVVTPAHAAGFVDVVVTHPDGQFSTLTSGFRYISAPTLASVDPTSGPATGGTKVTLTGTDLQPGLTVSFGGTDATTVVREGPTTVSVWTPAHAAGVVSIIVTNPDGQSATLTDAFTYTAVSPTIALVNPTQGPGAGGTPILVSGSGFLPGATLTFGGVEATQVQFVSTETLSARTPPHAEGPVDVVVTNTDGTTATLVSGFTYVGSPVVDAGTDGGEDAGTPDAGVADAGTVELGGGGGGCGGCAQGNGSSMAGFALLALGLVFSRRRVAVK